MYKLLNSAVNLGPLLSVAGDKLTVIVENLRVNISYEFKIAGQTKVGVGPFSNTITIKVIEPENLLKGKLLQAKSMGKEDTICVLIVSTIPGLNYL